MSRFKDQDWNLTKTANGQIGSWDELRAALLMDLRDELKEIRSALAPLRHLDCANFLAIPASLQAIARQTRKKRRVKR